MLETGEIRQLFAARAGDQDAFGGLIEPYRRELLVHCYRLVGSIQDAEDLLQETLLRAWRRLDTFQRNVSFRAWLYKIATNVCLNALAKRPRRILPEAASSPADPLWPQAPPAAEPAYAWLEPFPDEWLPEPGADPEARYTAHESLGLAFLVALQLLPPRQRAVLILCDVLDWKAQEVADLLEVTVSAVNSALHRARTTLAKHYPAAGHEAAPVRLKEASTLRLLEQYVQAMENADVAGLVALLKADAALSMPPVAAWYRGRDSIGVFFANTLFVGAVAGRWRMHPARANGRAAFGLYQRDEANGAYRIYALQVLDVDGPTGAIAEIVNFLDPRLFARFSLPDPLAP